MGDDYDKGGHPPPEMEDRSAFGWRPAAAAPYSKEDTQDFRPILRPAVPVVTVLDDGSQHGEAVRLRGDTFTMIITLETCRHCRRMSFHMF